MFFLGLVTFTILGYNVYKKVDIYNLIGNLYNFFNSKTKCIADQIGLQIIKIDTVDDFKIIHYNYDGSRFILNLDVKKIPSEIEIGTSDYIKETIKDYHENNITTEQSKRKIVICEMIDPLGNIEDITEYLKKLHGPKYNFYTDLKNLAPEYWCDILIDYDLEYWDKLIIVDSFSNIHTIHINNDVLISWNPNFQL